jgi:hypothetical protein
MTGRRLRNGNLLVPRRAEAEDGTIGDGWEEITPEHPDYEPYLKDLERWESIQGKKTDYAD